MNPLQRITAISSVVALASLVGSYWLTNYWQALVLSVGSAVLSVAIALVAVNRILLGAEKKYAAVPLFEFIQPTIHRLHNDLFVELGRTSLGKEQFEGMIGLYQKHQRSPQAFTPKQREDLYKMISGVRDELIAVYDLLSEQLRELTSMVGWSFDPKLMGLALKARLKAANFKSLPFDDADQSQQKIIEAYLDIDGIFITLADVLVTHAGLTERVKRR